MDSIQSLNKTQNESKFLKNVQEQVQSHRKHFSPNLNKLLNPNYNHYLRPKSNRNDNQSHHNHLYSGMSNRKGSMSPSKDNNSQFLNLTSKGIMNTKSKNNSYMDKFHHAMSSKKHNDTFQQRLTKFRAGSASGKKSLRSEEKKKFENSLLLRKNNLKRYRERGTSSPYHDASRGGKGEGNKENMMNPGNKARDDRNRSSQQNHKQINPFVPFGAVSPKSRNQRPKLAKPVLGNSGKKAKNKLQNVLGVANDKNKQRFSPYKKNDRMSYMSVGNANGVNYSTQESREYINKMKTFFNRGMQNQNNNFSSKKDHNSLNPIYKKYQYANPSRDSYGNSTNLMNMRGGALGDIRSGSVRGVSSSMRKPGLMLSNKRRRSNSPYLGFNKLDRAGFGNLKPTKRSRKKKNPLKDKYLERSSSKKSRGGNSSQAHSPNRKLEGRIININNYKKNDQDQEGESPETERVRMTANPNQDYHGQNTPQLHNPVKETHQNDGDLNEFYRFFEVIQSEYSKFKQLSFFEKCGFQLYSIKKNLLQKNDVYDLIRLYADFAQEKEFNFVERIFIDKDARMLFSRVLKLERWAIILLFYFKVENVSGPEFDNLAISLASEAWKNHNNLVNWIKILNKEHNMRWILNDMNRIYWDVNMDMVRLVIHIRSCCRIITGLINQM